MKFLVKTLTSVGGRETNQDCVREFSSPDAVCAAVCDGLGAYDGSDAAAEIAANTIVRGYRNSPVRGDDAEALKALVKAAHDKIAQYKESCADASGICTTVACAVTDSFGTAVAHIGDSRIYEFRGGTLRLLTRDHSLARIAVDRGEILMSDIRRHKDQNKLTRVLGGDYYVAPDCDVLPPLAPGDGLVICTDGMWEYVYEEDIEELFPQCDPQQLLTRFEEIIDRRKRRHNDNYTAAVIKAVE